MEYLWELSCHFSQLTKSVKQTKQNFPDTVLGRFYPFWVIGSCISEKVFGKMSWAGNIACRNKYSQHLVCSDLLFKLIFNFFST